MRAAQHARPGGRVSLNRGVAVQPTILRPEKK